MARNDVLYMAYGAGLRTSVIRFIPSPDLVLAMKERTTIQLPRGIVRRNVVRHIMPAFAVKKWWK